MSAGRRQFAGIGASSESSRSMSHAVRTRVHPSGRDADGSTTSVCEADVQPSTSSSDGADIGSTSDSVARDGSVLNAASGAAGAKRSWRDHAASAARRKRYSVDFSSSRRSHDSKPSGTSIAGRSAGGSA